MVKRKFIIAGGIGVALIALTGGAVAYYYNKTGNKKYLNMLGVVQGQEIGRQARDRIIKSIIKYAVQDYSTYGNSDCVSCLRYGMWSGGNGTAPQYHPEYKFWWDLYLTPYTTYETTGRKIENRTGCNPHLKFNMSDYADPNNTISPTDMAQFGDFTCMANLLKSAEAFKNQCQPCQGTSLR